MFTAFGCHARIVGLVASEPRSGPRLLLAIDLKPRAAIGEMRMRGGLRRFQHWRHTGIGGAKNFFPVAQRLARDELADSSCQ